MSELLQNWLNNEVGLSTNVANFEKDFASGYLFGEILHKFRQQDDFERFVNKSTYEAKLANFKRLEPTLKALGIKVNATQSNQMMNGERGASLRLLYQLKMATERLLLASDAGGSQQKRGPPGAGGAGAHKGSLLGGDVTKAIRVPREHFDKHERSFFEHRLRSTCPNAKQDRLKKVESKFEQEKLKQDALAFHMDRLEEAHVAEQREIHRFGTRERMRQHRLAKDDWTRSHIEQWGKNMDKRAQREIFDISFAQRVGQQHDNRSGALRNAARDEVLGGVESFELGLANLGLAKPKEKRANVVDHDTDSDASEASDLQSERLLAATTPAANARELVAALQARMPNGEELEQEAGLFLQKIKESKKAGNIARKERERRRRRVLVEQQREQDLLEESKLEDVLLEKLGRQSAEEKVIKYNVWKTQKYEEVVVKNRQVRQQAYLARRKEDQQEALRRDQDLRLELLSCVREQEERERQRYRTIERGRHAKRRAQVAEDCERILELIAGMAFAALEQKQITDVIEVDPTLWREWSALFVEGKELSAAESVVQSAAVMYPLTPLPISDPADQTGADAALHDAAFTDYVRARGQWAIVPLPREASAAPFNAVAEAQAALQLASAAGLSFSDKLKSDVDEVAGRPVDYRLGAIVAALLERRFAAPPAPGPPAMPKVPLRLVMTGKPYAGKKMLAARLAEAYNLQVLDVEEIVQECLMLSKRPDASQAAINVLSFTTDAMDDHCKRHEDDGNPYVKQLQELGYEVQDVLDRGEALSDELYVTMVITKIRSLFPKAVQLAKGVEPAADGVVEESALQQPASLTEAEDEKSTSPADDVEQAVAANVGQDADEIDTVAAGAGEGEKGHVVELEDGQNVLDGVSGEGAETGADATNLAKLKSSAKHGSTEGGAIEPSGWILVGFPDTAERLQLLERFMSGWVEDSARPTPEADQYKARAALVAPAPPQTPPPFALRAGGYDLHFRMDVHGDEVLRRAFGLHRDPATSLTYHLEDHPPSSKHQVIYERLQPVDDVHNSTGTLTNRIHSFDIAQEEVDYILSYFGPFPDCQRLTIVDANKVQDDVYEALDEHIAVLLERKREEQAREEESLKAAQDAARKASDEATAAAAVATAEPLAVAADEARGPTPTEPVHELPPVELKDLPKAVSSQEEVVFQLLLEEWQSLEHDFVNDSRELFTWHRGHLADFRSGLHSIQRHFLDFLQRPDDKQSHVDNFVQEFNAFSEEYPDMRKQDTTKEELHQRADDLQGRLESEINEDRRRSLEHLDEIEKSGWVEAQVDVVAAQVQHTVQMEARRYHSACQMLSDFYFGAMNVGLPPPREAPIIDVLSGKEEAPEVQPEPKAKAKAKAKGKVEEEPPEADNKGNTKRKYVEPKLNEATGELAPGRWEFPFLHELMEKAQKVIWPLEEFVPPASAEKMEDEGGDPKAKAKAKAKGKAAPQPDTAAHVAVPQLSPWYVDFQQALVAERVTYMHRLVTLRSWAHRRLLALSTAGSEAFAQCRDWVLLRRQKQLEAVEGLVEILKEHIESDPPQLINARLTLEGAHLHCHPNVRLQPPAPEISPPCIEAMAPFRWTISQLDGLLEMISGVARAIGEGSTLVPVRTVQAVFARVTQDFGGELGCKEPSRVPTSWLHCHEERLLQFCSLFECAPRGGTVDCVELLLHVGLLHSPLGWPSLEELLTVRTVLERKTPPGAAWPDFYISLEELAALPLFSDPVGKESKFAKQYALQTASTPSAFNRVESQLRWVGQVLQRFPAPPQSLESWSLEAAWHDYLVRGREESERIAEHLNDMRSTSSNSPRSPTDGLGLLISGGSGAGAGPGAGPDDDEDETRPRPLPPRPERPRSLLERPQGSISVRQLLAYLCLGSDAAEGFARALAVLGPFEGSAAPTAATVQAALLQLGARPLPPGQAGDGRPPLPSRSQICEELGLPAQAVSGRFPSSALSGPAVAALLERFGLSRRHCRVQDEVDKLFPRSGKGAGQKPRLAQATEPT